MRANEEILIQPSSIAAPYGLPSSVRYVKNGDSGKWWKAARENKQVHAGWKSVPGELLRAPDFPEIERLIKDAFGTRQGATQDFNALCDLLDGPSKHLWLTFEDGYLWWCTVRDGASVNPDGESTHKGNFWLACDRPWSNYSVGGKLLSIAHLPGTVTTTGGFRGTVCTPRDWQTTLRIIRDEKDADAAIAVEARSNYVRAVNTMVKRLSPKDFEQLIDLILARTGWARISTIGNVREGIDIEAENPTSNEIAFVQVKSSATQHILEDYIQRFQARRDFYARMIFVVHSPANKLAPPACIPEVQVWTGNKVAQLVVRLGLGEWVESKIA
jgi:hypothetical protein